MRETLRTDHYFHELLTLSSASIDNTNSGLIILHFVGKLLNENEHAQPHLVIFQYIWG
jgi:hypothetical protein